jgi:hypothetical protein
MDPVTLSLLIGGGTALIGSIAQGASASGAAESQEEAARTALELQRQMWLTQRADQAPWLQAGKNSLQDLLNLTRDPSSITGDPAYQFRLSEGQRALERSASARGMLSSGGALRSLSRYSQGVASDEYANRWNRLSSLAGVGQTTAQNLGALGGQYANQAGNLYGALGNAQAAGQIGVGNAINNGFGQLGGMGMMAASRIPTQGMGMYGMANPATQMIDPSSMPRFG